MDKKGKVNTKTMPDERFLKMSRFQIEDILQISGSPYASRISDLMIDQLRLGIYDDRVHSHRVIDEIQHLEGVKSGSRTVPEDEFRGGALRGFRKKHFTQSDFIGQNLLNGMKMNSPGSKKFENLARSLAKQIKDKQRFASVLAHKFTVETYEELARKGRLTGEWIVFSRFENKNYYLTLASHRESTDAIFQRLHTNCVKQFPFLFASIDKETP